MSAEKHPINQCHYGATVKVLQEKIDWQNLEIIRITKKLKDTLSRSYILMDAWRPIGWRDHACVECGDGPIVIKGFACAYHSARKYFEVVPK